MLAAAYGFWLDVPQAMDSTCMPVQTCVLSVMQSQSKVHSVQPPEFI